MPRIDYLPSGTNTNSQRVIVNDNLDGFGSYREANKVSNEELEKTIRQNLAKIAIQMFLMITIQTWKLSPRLPTMRKLKRKWPGWRLNARVAIP